MILLNIHIYFIHRDQFLLDLRKSLRESKSKDDDDQILNSTENDSDSSSTSE